MDFTQYQAQYQAQPVAFQPIPMHFKDKSYLHRAVPTHDIHGPLSIAIPQTHLERARMHSNLMANAPPLIMLTHAQRQQGRPSAVYVSVWVDIFEGCVCVHV